MILYTGRVIYKITIKRVSNLRMIEKLIQKTLKLKIVTSK